MRAVAAVILILLGCGAALIAWGPLQNLFGYRDQPGVDVSAVRLAVAPVGRGSIRWRLADTRALTGGDELRRRQDRIEGQAFSASCPATLRMSRRRGCRRQGGFVVSAAFSKVFLSDAAPCPPMPGGAPAQPLRPIASFGFSMRTTPEEAVATLVAVLDEVDPEWRSFVQVWDGLRGGVANPVRG
jgi:hypothetical protein